MDRLVQAQLAKRAAAAQQRRKFDVDDDDDDDDDDDNDNEKRPSSSKPHPAPSTVPKGAEVELFDASEMDFRNQFPSGFGKAKGPEVKLAEVHDSFARAPASDLASRKAAAEKEKKARLAAIAEAQAIAKASTQPTVMPGSGSEQNAPADTEQDDVGPRRPPPGTENLSDSDDGDQEDDSEPEDSYRIPCSHEAVLQGHTKAITALGIDPAGARVATGGFDFFVKLYDFAGMDRSMRPFRSSEPCESHQIRQLQFSLTGAEILVASAAAKLKIIDRDGKDKKEFVKGDMYLNDMAHTKGHTHTIHMAHWHPSDKNGVLSCADDATIRIWNVETADEKQKQVIKLKAQTGHKTVPYSCAYSPCATIVAGACIDGSIQLFDPRGQCHRPAQVIYTAHGPGTETSCLLFARNSQTLVSRGGDDTVKVWDVRNFKKPLKVHTGLPNLYAHTDCGFSPDERLIFTGTSVKKGEGNGSLVFIDRQTLEIVQKLSVTGSVIRTKWHQKINQILATCSDGKTRILYNPSMSEKGAMLCVTREPRKTAADDIFIPREKDIVNPEERRELKRKRREEGYRDPRKLRRPDPPINGAGHGGRPGMNFQHALLKSMGMTEKKAKDGEDPREAILKYAKAAEEDPFFTKAYQETQPKAIFDLSQQEEEQEGGH
eukprot:tig00000704_g3327.t1